MPESNDVSKGDSPEAASNRRSPPALEKQQSYSQDGPRRFRQRSEASRSRDVFRTLLAWEEIFASGRQRSSLSSQNGRQLQVPDHPQFCPDKALTALAQLTALRMNAKTCLLSLCCRETEYILGDATATMSLQGGNAHTPGTASPWLGYAQFDLSQGLTAQALEQWQKARNSRELPEEDDHYYTSQLTQHCFIISDVRTSDWRHKRLPLLQQGQWIRFYGSVPLRNSKGSIIGSLTILDDRPRYGISNSELTLMEDIADSISEHLFNTVVRAQQSRSEKLLQSLSLFNAGEDSMREWWSHQDDARTHNKGRNDASAQLRMQGRAERANVEFGRETSGSARDAASSYFDPRSPTRSQHGDESPMISERIATPQITKTRNPNKPRHPSRPLRRGLSSNVTADSIPEAYNRAAGLVREAMGLEGVLFINLDSSATGTKSNDISGSTSSSSDNADAPTHDDPGRTCDVHSCSIRINSEDQIEPTSSIKLSQQALKRLMRRYKQGQIFHYDPDGTVHISTDDDSDRLRSNDEATQHDRQRKADVEHLGRALTGVHSAAFYPIWDTKHERWLSCAVAWSVKRTRVLGPGQDLAYLRTFSHSLLAELSRIETALADEVKSTFISSISHEMRTPLHGILAGAEFLQSTDLSTFQQEMTETIEVAGRTLLDTVDHILEYSKMSSTMRAGKSSDESTLDQALSTSVTESSTSLGVDLAKLTEDIVETCVSAHRSQSRNLPDLVRQRGPRKTDRAISGEAVQNVACTLNIDHRDSWLVHAQSGAWTRILANVLINSLKYTRDGRVSVRLSARDLTTADTTVDATNHKQHKLMVTLVVEDTGIGISDAFLKANIFVPFKQEDPYTPGIGLGLSIVNQICNNIGAKLTLTSTVGKGTKVTVQLPIAFLQGDDLIASQSQSSSTGFTGQSSGNSDLNVDSFHLYSSATMSGMTDFAGNEHPTEIAIAKSVMDIAEEWLKCTSVSQVGDLDSSEAATADTTVICAITEHLLEAWREQNPEQASLLLEKLGSRYSHVLVLAESIQSMSLDSAFAGTTPWKQIFVHQPIGPAKLLRAIASDKDSTAFAQMLSSPGPDISRQNTKSLMLRSPELPPRPALSTQSTMDALVEVERRPSAPQKQIARSDRSSSSRSSSSCEPQSTQDSTAPSSAVPGADRNLARRQQLLERRSQGPRKVLLVEDNEVNMRLLTALISKLRLPYERAMNGREAVDIFRASPPSTFMLILMDINMPVMNGFVATTKIRDHEAKRNLQNPQGRAESSYIVALTGNTDEASRTQAFNCGVDKFYSKPVRMRELKTILEDLQRQDGNSGDDSDR